MARVTPQEYAEKLARRLSAATADISRGIDRVTEAPGAAAVAQKENLRAHFNEALDSGKWERNTSAVTLSEWKAAAKDKGVGRIGPGINAAKPKLVKFASELLPAVDAAAAVAKAMPKGTLEERVQRSVAYQMQMSQFKKT
jgi:hypothetical protein